MTKSNDSEGIRLLSVVVVVVPEDVDVAFVVAALVTVVVIRVVLVDGGAEDVVSTVGLAPGTDDGCVAGVVVLAIVVTAGVNAVVDGFVELLKRESCGFSVLLGAEAVDMAELDAVDGELPWAERVEDNSVAGLLSVVAIDIVVTVVVLLNGAVVDSAVTAETGVSLSVDVRGDCVLKMVSVDVEGRSIDVEVTFGS